MPNDEPKLSTVYMGIEFNVQLCNLNTIYNTYDTTMSLCSVLFF